MSLLPLTAAVPVFAPLAGRHVGVVFYPDCGNAGDRLIEAATRQLLGRFGVSYEEIDPAAVPAAVEVVLLGGGGNYGHPKCPAEARRRALALGSGRPCVLLPQTAYGFERGSGYPHEAAFVRDTHSQALIPNSALAPDLVMCWEPPAPVPLAHELGLFFGKLPESLWPAAGADPRTEFTDPLAYYRHVAGHLVVHTDSLHAAICGLTAGRFVTLYPTALHKTRSWWQTWGRHLGCGWAEGAPPC